MSKAEVKACGPAHEILILIASASSEGLGESTHMCRLARALAAGIKKEWM